MQQLTFNPEPKIPSKLTLELRGLVIPSFKNNKILIAKSPQGKPLDRPLLITKPEFQKIMARMVASIESQLRCAFRTEDGATLTGVSLRSAIALSMPEDDCWTQVPEISIRGELCEPGQEGATITIERL
jgi:hypothetical protein